MADKAPQPAQGEAMLVWAAKVASTELAPAWAAVGAERPQAARRPEGPWQEEEGAGALKAASEAPAGELARTAALE